MAISVHPLSSAVGAEIRGIDASRPIDAVDAKQIRDALWRHQVIFLRGQELDAPSQGAFAQMFGPLQKPRTAPEVTGKADYMYVANRTVEGMQGVLPDGEMQFHTDQCYYELPSRATFLYAIEVPSKGGNTMFASTVAAYATLPQALKDRLAGLKALHVYDYANAAQIRTDEPSPDAPHFVHPVVIRHPETGKPILYVNRLMTHHLVGIPRPEGEALLETLFAHIEQRAFVYEHVWRPGDLVVWDNFATLHARTDFDPKERRVMRRFSVAGPRPEAASAQAA
ncbi:MAG TPA: TauD/TfdA family dioxygenase [Alphaproteobacteria bacterium]